jgi:hypothetical protein
VIDRAREENVMGESTILDSAATAEPRGTRPPAAPPGEGDAAESFSLAAAGRRLRLRPREAELAAQLGEVATLVAADGGRRVPRAELDRLLETPDGPERLRARVVLVGTADAAELLQISQGRFTRLARAGCFAPVRFDVNRYRAVVWHYLPAELRAFAEDRPDLLTGHTPPQLRAALAEGVDLRARHWRGRRVEQLRRWAPGPWERAAVRAAVLDAAALAEAVPDEGERQLLMALRPELVSSPTASPRTRETVAALCTATDEDEVLWHRLMLAADLDVAREAADPRLPERTARPRTVRARTGRGARRGGLRRWLRGPGPARPGAGTGPPGRP